MYSDLLLYHCRDRIRNNRVEIRWDKGVNEPTPSRIPVMASDLLGVPCHQTRYSFQTLGFSHDDKLVTPTCILVGLHRDRYAVFETRKNYRILRKGIAFCCIENYFLMYFFWLKQWQLYPTLEVEFTPNKRFIERTMTN